MLPEITPEERERREIRGGDAVRAGSPDYGQNEPQTDVVDALANIRHHCEAHGLDFDAAAASAARHVEAERGTPPRIVPVEIMDGSEAVGLVLDAIAVCPEEHVPGATLALAALLSMDGSPAEEIVDHVRERAGNALDSESERIVREHERCAFQAARQAHTHLAEAVENGAQLHGSLAVAADLQRRLAEELPEEVTR